MEINYKSKFLKVILAFSVAVGASTIANADTYAQQLAYSQFAPKTQTTYKLHSTTTQPIENAIAQNDKVIMYANGGPSGKLVNKAANALGTTPYVGTTIRAVRLAGYAAGVLAAGNNYYLEDFKKASVLKKENYFKWLNPNELSYSVMTKSWVEFNGQRVSEIKTSYNNAGF